MNIKKIFIKKLASIELAISLFSILAILIAIGTYFPQEPQMGRTALIERFGLNTYQNLKNWGLNDIFHSCFYLSILFLLGINLLTVSFTRVFKRAKKAILFPEFLYKIPINTKAQFMAQLNIKDWSAFLELCKKNNWQIKINSQNNSAILRKGAFHRLGASITHIGILTTMFGAFLGLLFGFNGSIQGISGDRFILSDKQDSIRSYILVKTSRIFHLPFWLGSSPEIEVEIGDTERVNYKNGSPKQWSTNLKFYSNKGKLLAQDKVSVNNPISFRGIDFYQADWNRVLRLKFNGQNFELILDKLNNSQTEIAFTPLNENLGLLFLFNPNSNKLQLISVKGNSFSVENIQKNYQKYLKTLANLSINEQAQIGIMNFKFIGVFSKTGLQYKYSFGDNLIILGMSILIMGVLIAFGSKRVIWAIKDDDKIILIGNTDRSKNLFAKEFEKLIQEF